MTKTVLVVEEDATMRSTLSEALMDAKYSVVKAADGKSALQNFHEFKPDIAVLDFEISDVDGLELCRQIRSFRNIPIIFTNGNDSEIDQLQAFASGADDYLTKPMSPRLLTARIGVIVRRTENPQVDKSRFVVGPLELDVVQRTLKVNGEEVGLTRIEFDILRPLMASPERAVSRNELIELAWGTWFGDTHMIESHVSRMRAKIRNAGGPEICQVVRGIGYRLGLKE